MSLTSAWDGVGWSNPRPGHFTPHKREPVPIVQEAGWASGLVWTGVENLAPTSIRSPGHLARGESLYQVRYLIYKYTCSQIVDVCLNYLVQKDAYPWSCVIALLGNNVEWIWKWLYKFKLSEFWDINKDFSVICTMTRSIFKGGCNLHHFIQILTGITVSE
jgi:hypothetical protein